jgi:hypothetical protein
MKCSDREERIRGIQDELSSVNVESREPEEEKSEAQDVQDVKGSRN